MFKLEILNHWIVPQQGKNHSEIDEEPEPLCLTTKASHYGKTIRELHGACGVDLAIRDCHTSFGKGHPTPTQARDMLLPEKSRTAAELINEGTVLEVIHANEFTYIEINRIDGRKWVAAQKMEIPLGAHIRYEDGAVMQNFYSKLLKRTFPSVMFVDHVVVTTQP